nr:tRNA methyltransferase 10 homolog B [Paramormyrops kingsleyae]XP_023681162.1 tRNA methyltransferase 10 homolog B [Paramormyrops kingsleyae]XP_023681163.1 tRNA methyltransferase 10 homolog B [Paramormyrops kingsleyae]
MNWSRGVGQEAASSQDGDRLEDTEESGLSDALGLLHIEIDCETAGKFGGDGEEILHSKNVLRKQRNWERKLAAKRSKRRGEKLRRRQRRAEASGDAGAAADSLQDSKRVLKVNARERLAQARVTGPRLCVDLSVAVCMSPKEISRLAGQIGRLYGSNRRARKPFHLFLTDLKEDSLLYRECQRMNDGFLRYAIDITEDSFLDLFPQESVIYLTPDAEQALEYVEPDKVYVLGGLVDESVQKKITYLRARDGGVPSARLPISEYMVKKTNAKNYHSKILAINQVFDILLTFCDTGSWAVALGEGIPPGKGYIIRTDDTPQIDH